MCTCMRQCKHVNTLARAQRTGRQADRQTDRQTQTHTAHALGHWTQRELVPGCLVVWTWHTHTHTHRIQFRGLRSDLARHGDCRGIIVIVGAMTSEQAVYDL